MKGAPSSALLSEIFLQYIEFTFLEPITTKHHITGYFQYVDDILITYDSSQINLQIILQDFNNIHPKLKFTAEPEHNNNINYLDLSINRTSSEFKFQMYRKPTFSDTIIPADSNHPSQHKYAAIRFLYNRLQNYNLDTTASSKELKNIHNILHNDGFPIKSYNFSHRENKHADNHTTKQKQKRVTFTYTGKETKFITQIFKNKNIQILYKTRNSVKTLLTTKHHKQDR
jgi:ribosomal protein S8